MRSLSATLFVLSVSFTYVHAQTMPTMPPSTYPQAGTFCGLFELCPPVKITKEEGISGWN